MISIIYRTSKTLKACLHSAKPPFISSLIKASLAATETPYHLSQKSTYVNVYMKWKKDPFYDSIQSINRAPELKPLISLKNTISRDPNGCIPISVVSKKDKELGIPVKVATFLRKYPSVFEEFVGPQYNLPWFRLTPRAIEIDKEEKAYYADFKSDMRIRLKKLILMSRDKRLPLRIVHGMKWYLGLPDDYLDNPDSNLDESFKFMELDDGEKWLAVDCEEKVLSQLQKNGIKKGICVGDFMESLPFPFIPPKGMRIKTKIIDWLDEFQKLPYVSPYEDFYHLNPNSDVAEKRVVGVLHELLSLFVEHAAERRKILCLKKFLGLPQKFHKVFERHVHVFYLSMNNKSCTAILKEAYQDRSGIERHPLGSVRKRYIKLMNQSEVILKQRRQKGRIAMDDVQQIAVV